MARTPGRALEHRAGLGVSSCQNSALWHSPLLFSRLRSEEEEKNFLLYTITAPWGRPGLMPLSKQEWFTHPSLILKLEENQRGAKASIS